MLGKRLVVGPFVCRISMAPLVSLAAGALATIALGLATVTAASPGWCGPASPPLLSAPGLPIVHIQRGRPVFRPAEPVRPAEPAPRSLEPHDRAPWLRDDPGSLGLQGRDVAKELDALKEWDPAAVRDSLARARDQARKRSQELDATSEESKEHNPTDSKLLELLGEPPGTDAPAVGNSKATDSGGDVAAHTTLKKAWEEQSGALPAPASAPRELPYQGHGADVVTRVEETRDADTKPSDCASDQNRVPCASRGAASAGEPPAGKP